MKKFLVILMAFCLLSAVCAAEEKTEIYVSITDDTGKLVLAYESLPLIDADEDGAITINDALLTAHIQRHENGAKAYVSEQSPYGLSLVVLWDIDNGGSFGYYLNNASPLSLADPIKAGEHVKAYAFTDLETWSDTYCFFENDALEAIPGNISFTLYASGYDASWNPVTLPVADAVITVNGEATDCKTDAEGKAVLSIDQPGKYVISAVSETQNLVAPVCILTITEIK